MTGLERSSPSQARATPRGRVRHSPREQLPRHPHHDAFAAVVLSGGYIEAGDTGRHRLEPGDVVLHRAWESHLDRFDRRGAEVLLLTVDNRDAARISGRIADPDALVRVAEQDPVDAARQLMADLIPKPAIVNDWPDLLADALRVDPALALRAWAREHGLHIGSISRGFRQVFDMTPLAFRLVQRTWRAIEAIQGDGQPLYLVAQDCGFADQAHMSRAIRGLVGTTPSALRKPLSYGGVTGMLRGHECYGDTILN